MMVPSEFEHFRDPESDDDCGRSRSPRRQMNGDSDGEPVLGLNTPQSPMSDISGWEGHESIAMTPEGYYSDRSEGGDVLFSIPRTPPTPPGGFGNMVPRTPPMPIYLPQTPPELLLMACAPKTPESQ